MSVVWSCNEWDPLEEVIVGNPLGARLPTRDLSTRLAEFADRSLAEIPQGPFPQQVMIGRWAGIVHVSEGTEQLMLDDSLTGDPLQVTLVE